MDNLRDTSAYFRKDPKTKKYVMQKWRRNILPVWLTYNLASNTGALTVAASGTATKTVDFNQPYFSNNMLDSGMGTPLEIRSLIYNTFQSPSVTPSQFLINMYEGGEVRQFMNKPVHVETMFGTGQLPAVLREPFFFPSMHFIQMNAYKISGAATSAYLYLNGAQYYPWAPSFLEDKAGKAKLMENLQQWKIRRQYVSPYWLTPTAELPSQMAYPATSSGVLVPQNGTVSARAKVGDDGHFEALTLMAYSDGPFGLTISEAFTHQQLMNGQITQTNGIGTARYPTMFPTGYVLPAGRYLIFTITDLSGLQAGNNVYITIGGRRIYAPLAKAADVEKRTRVKLSPTVYPPVPADTSKQLIPMGPH